MGSNEKENNRWKGEPTLDGSARYIRSARRIAEIGRDKGAGLQFRWGFIVKTHVTQGDPCNSRIQFPTSTIN